MKKPIGTRKPVKGGRIRKWVAQSKEAGGSVNTPTQHRNNAKDNRQQRKRQHRQLGGRSQRMSTFGQPSAFGAPSRSAPTLQPNSRSASPFDASSHAASSFGQPSGHASSFGAPSAFAKNKDQPPRASSPFDRLAKPANPFASESKKTMGTSGASARNSFGTPSPTASSQPHNPFAPKPAPTTNPFGGPAVTAKGQTNPFARTTEKVPNGLGARDSKSNGRAQSTKVAERASKRRGEFEDRGSSRRRSPGPSDTSSVETTTAFSSVKEKPDDRKRKNGIFDRPNTKRQDPKLEQPRTTSGANGAPAAYAHAIHNQLRKDGLNPPKWPSEPGNPATRQAMEDFKEEYKQYQSRVRKSLIKAGLIDDPDVRKKLEDAINFRGICEEMCPEYEKISRIVEYDVKQPEKEKSPDGLSMWPSPKRMVKAFKRSAAGMDAPLPIEVLSPAALRRTVDYLIDDLLRDDERLPVLHNFLWDRTRAVRKDFIFQNAMTPEERRDQIYCLETIARFHATALHLLSEEGVASEDFSEQQEREQLGKSLLSLIQAYDETDGDGLGNENEAEFRAYYILFNAHDPFVKQQIQEWDSSFWFDSDEVQTAISLVEAMQNVWRGRGPLRPQVPLSTTSTPFTTYFSIVENPNVSYTMACFAEIHFAEVRQHLLRTINKAFGRVRDNPKDLTAEAVNNILRFDSTDECIEFLEQHGMEFSSEGATEPYLLVDKRKHIPSATVKHSFSATLVERKRGDRSLPEVIHTTVFEEEEGLDGAQEQDSESMFLPQPSEPVVSQGSSKSSHGASEDSIAPQPPKQPAASIVDHTSPAIFGAPAMTDGVFGSKGSLTTEPMKTVDTNTFQRSPFATSSSGAPTATGASQKSAPAQPPKLSWAASTPSTSITTDQMAIPPAVPKFPWSTPAGESKPTAPTPSSKEVPSIPSMKDQPKEPKISLFSTTSEPGKAEDRLPAAYIGQGVPAANKFQAGSTDFTTPSAVQFPATSTGGLKSGAPTFTSISEQGVASSQQQQTPSVFSPSSGAGISKPPAPPASDETLAVPQPTHTAQPNKLFQASPAAAAPTMPAPPQPAAAKQPPGDLMGDFTQWFVQGDGGIMEQFEENVVETLVKGVYETYKDEQEERKRKEEDAQSWADALKFRRYNLGLKFFYRWRANARKLAMRRIGREGRAAIRAWREAKAAEAKAAKEKVARAEQARLKRLNDGSIVEELRERAAKKARRSSSNGSLEEALLATGIFSGLSDEREAAARCAKDDDSLYEALIRPLPDSRQSTSSAVTKGRDHLRSTGAGVTKNVSKPRESKKMRMIRQLFTGKQPLDEDANSVLGLSRSRSSSLRRSLPAGSKLTNFTKYQRSTAGSSTNSGEKQKSGVQSDYWRLKARGLITMPNGLALHESLALPMIRDGVRYQGIGDYGLGPGVPLESDGSPSVRRSTNSLEELPSDSSLGRSYMKPPAAVKSGQASGSLETGSRLSRRHSDTQYDWEADLEQTLKEFREVGAEMDETTEWLREQNEQMSKTGTPMDG
ncbi:SAC3 family protein 1 [Pleurostoma richardsiae]|uniref:SAC3 family protein 1 n=1 Tax=Pleurostoma richardsiae TaxID=41990 RepID=A0AA38RLA5_9PEZI|nr:SAC3 family protein 1 [Pleurostoma richardsiae]